MHGYSTDVAHPADNGLGEHPRLQRDKASGRIERIQRERLPAVLRQHLDQRSLCQLPGHQRLLYAANPGPRLQRGNEREAIVGAKDRVQADALFAARALQG